MKYKPIKKFRREAFGSLVFFEKPGFVAHINEPFSDALGIKKADGAIFRDGVYSAPLDAHLALTTRCNLYCEGCYSVRKDDGHKDIPLDRAKRIIDNLSRLGVFSVSFGGGEPTLYPRLTELAEYTRSKNILPNMTTNGLTLCGENPPDLSVFGNVHISLHSMKDLARVETAARVYRKTAGKKPGLNFLLTSETEPYLEDVASFAKKNKFSKVLFLRYKITSKNENTDGLAIDFDEKNIAQRITKAGEKTKMMFMFDCSMLPDIASLDGMTPEKLRRFDDNGCLGGNSYIAIDTDGRYKPCSFWSETFGDAETLDYAEWNTLPQLENFRDINTKEECSSCRFLSLCRGGCRLNYCNEINS